MRAALQYYYYNRGQGYSVNYHSDFSAGVDVWSPVRTVISGSIDGIGGLNDVLKAYADAGTNTHGISRAVISLGNINRISFKYYIPSGQTNVSGIRVTVNASTNIIDVANAVKDTWNSVTTDEFTADSVVLQFLFRTPTTHFYTGANSPTDDIIYFRDIVVEYRTP